MDARNEYQFMPDGSVRIALTGGHFAYVDAEDFPIVAPHRWNAAERYGCLRARNGTRKHGIHTTTYMHQLLMPDGESDHIDGDGLNNRRSNLRYVNRQQNQMNRHKRSAASSRFKGVWKEAQGKRCWRARIQREGKVIRTGSFFTEEEAAQAYDDLAREHFGEFARLNFPREGEQSALE